MRSFGGRDGFLMRGVATAFLKLSGKHALNKDMLTSFLIDGSRMSTHSLNKNVGIGSRRQDLVGDSFTNLRISSSDTALNLSKEEGTVLGDTSTEGKSWKQLWNLPGFFNCFFTSYYSYPANILLVYLCKKMLKTFINQT